MTEPDENANPKDKAETPTAAAPGSAPGKVMRAWDTPKVSRLSIAETETAAGSAPDFEGTTL